MTSHKYFGRIIQNEWYDFHSTMEIGIPNFSNSAKVKLVEYDEDFEPVGKPLTEQLLDECAETLKSFSSNIDVIIEDIKKSVFENYLKIYVKYYEKPFEVLWENQKIKKRQNQELHESLQIDTKEKHFEYMNSVLEKIIISNNKTIIIPLRH